MNSFPFTVNVTVSPTFTSPPTVPVTGISCPDSAAFITSSSVIFGSKVIVAVPITTAAAAGRVGPDSTGIVLIDSLKFSQTLVSAIPFKESSNAEKIELKVEPFPVALPCPAPGPAAAASRESIND